MEISYNIPKIQKILDSVYELFGVPVFFISSHGTSLAGVKMKSDKFDFCMRAEQFPEMHNKCVACDKKLLSKCEKSCTPEWHFCYAGLYDGVVPVLKDGVIAGYVLYGHVKTDGTVFPENIYSPEFQLLHEKSPYFSKEFLNSFSQVLSNINFVDCIYFNDEKFIDKEFENYFEDKINKYIDNNIDKELNVSSICSYFHISRALFYKKWSQNSEISFLNYVLIRRINKAKKMIRETRLPICKIAEMVGIDNYSHFFSVFKKQIGMSPGQYRKRIN